MKDFISFAWWRICVVLVSTGIMLCGVSTAVEHSENRIVDEQCREVLKCMDLGVARDHCDALYPSCPEREP